MYVSCEISRMTTKKQSITIRCAAVCDFICQLEVEGIAVRQKYFINITRACIAVTPPMAEKNKIF